MLESNTGESEHIQQSLRAFFKQLPLTTIEDKIVLGKLHNYSLAAPESFWRFYYAGEDISSVVNGCGPAGAGDRLIPDTAYLMSIKAACMIHDWMYTIYNDEEGFRLSNQIFLDNMLRINHAHTKNKVLYVLRFKRIMKYYNKVQDFGRLFYYDNHVDLYPDKAIYKERMYNE